MKNLELERQELLEFQPRLAGAIFQLDRLRHEASKEKRSLSARERSMNPKWLEHRLALLDHYKRKLDLAAERGRVLGDNFAWLFYCQDELHLLEHLEHGAVPQIPSGLGGLVEVDFVNKFPLIEDRFLPLYHGTTTFLRVGDLSLIDVSRFRLAGLGELKAGPLENGQARVLLSVVGNRELFKPVNTSEDHAHPFPLRSPERFKRQMQRMVDVATVSPPTEKRRLRLGVDYSSLEGVFEEATSSGLAFRQVSDSLALAVVGDRPHPSLYCRMGQPLPERIWEQLRELPPKLYPLFTERLEDNALWIGDLVLKYLPGTTPILWSAMPNELVQGIFEERVVVVTLYNPARLIQRLRALGFEVSIVKEEATLSIVYSGADLRAEVHNSTYFLSLIQHFLVDESSVAEAIHDLVRDGVSGRFGQEAEIIWKPMQFRPEVEDLENSLGPPRSPRSS